MVKSWPGPGQKYNLLYLAVLTHPVSLFSYRNNGFLGVSLAYLYWLRDIAMSIPFKLKIFPSESLLADGPCINQKQNQLFA